MSTTGTARPAWRDKFPCHACGASYSDCSTGLAVNLMCCKDCAHPERWSEGYGREELDDMHRRAGMERPW